jgi:hypothetical protein
MMSIVKRIREMTPAQRAALRALDQEERSATELDDLEAEHLAAEEAYLRRKDQLLGREVQARYEEIDTARAELERRVAERARRFERLRMAVLAGHGIPSDAEPTEQLPLLPQN